MSVDELEREDEQTEPATRWQRLATGSKSGPKLIDGAVRAATLAIGTAVLTALCLSLHAGTVWLGLAACVLLIASLLIFIRPVLTSGARGWPSPTPADQQARTRR